MTFYFFSWSFRSLTDFLMSFAFPQDKSFELVFKELQANVLERAKAHPYLRACVEFVKDSSFETLRGIAVDRELDLCDRVALACIFFNDYEVCLS